MLSALIAVAALLTGALVAASLRFGNAIAALLCGYVVLVAEIAALTALLSPLREVTRGGLAVASACLLTVSAAAWVVRGRPGLPLQQLPATLRQVLADPLVTVFALLVGAALAYELMLVALVPANNWDSLTYHLTRVAFWVRHGGIYWVANAPTDRINAAQPLAEQEILYLSVALGTGTLFALPQFLAELAIVAATYLSARRLGFDLRGGACAALAFTTLALVGLEATTAQNDLVAASLPAAAAAFLLGRSRPEILLAGLATALSLAVKATSALVLPVLLVIALAGGRRRLGLYAASSGLSFAALGAWSYLLNLAHTGHLLASGLTHLSTSLTGTLAMATAIAYRLVDLPGLHDEAVWLLALAGACVALGAVCLTLLRRRGGAWLPAAAVGLPFAAPLLALALASTIHGLVSLVGLPVGVGRAFGQFSWQVNRLPQEDLAGFGPVGGLMLVGASLWAIVAVARRRDGLPLLALGLALPLFILLLGATTASYNPFLGRFAIVPAALAVPLTAVYFRRTAAGLALAAVAAFSLGVTLVEDVQKPLDSRYGHPWQLSQVDAVRLSAYPDAGDALFGLDTDLPSWMPIGAVLAEEDELDPSYLLFGATHSRPVEFLPRDPAGALREAASKGELFVVIAGVPGVAQAFEAQGWAVTNLVDPYWQLAIDCRVVRSFYPCPSPAAAR